MYHLSFSLDIESTYAAVDRLQDGSIEFAYCCEARLLHYFIIFSLFFGLGRMPFMPTPNKLVMPCLT
jgi:hypothetical protein